MAVLSFCRPTPNWQVWLARSDKQIIMTLLQLGWLIDCLVSGAPNFVIWHHSLIHYHNLAPLIKSVLILVFCVK